MSFECREMVVDAMAVDAAVQAEEQAWQRCG